MAIETTVSVLEQSGPAVYWGFQLRGAWILFSWIFWRPFCHHYL